ncbi:nitroreductase, partial [Streptomyces sp. SID5998]|nr:nitroreductase [Streptomyces sp. SID5998]
KALLRDFAGRRRVPGRGGADFEESPRLAVLSTRGDTPADWLVAGQALERVLLEATAAGLATSLTSHPLESPELRPLARDPVTGRGQVQMVLRLGYGPPGPATPRRPVADVLDVEPDAPAD